MGIRSRLRRKARKVKSRVRKSASRVRSKARKTTSIVRSKARKTTSIVRSKTKSKVSTSRRKVTKATQRGKTRLGKRIKSFKSPASRLKTTKKVSSRLTSLKTTFLKPSSRIGKMLGNLPFVFGGVGKIGADTEPRIKFPSLPKIRVPKISMPVFPGLGIASKIKDIGFPSIPSLPDIPGFFKSKIEDVAGTIGGVVDNISGAAEDWQAKRDRTKFIFKAVLFGVLALIVSVLWRKLRK